MKTLLRMIAFVSAFALSFAPLAANANISPAITVVQAPNSGMTLARSATFETGSAAVETYVEVNSNCSSRITLFSIGGSSAPHVPLLSVYAPTCTGALTIQALIGGVNRTLHSSTSLTTGVQEYVTASYDGTTLSMTLNGNVIASQTFSGTLGPTASASSLGIGRSYDTYADNFPGAIWATKIYSSGLANSQIATDYAASPYSPPYGLHLTVPVGVSGALVTAPVFSSTSSVSLGAKNLSGQILADSPAVYYRLNEASGTTAYDSSGHNQTGTYSTTVVSSSSLTYPGTGPILVASEPDYSTFIPDNTGTTSSLSISVPDNTTYLHQSNHLSAEATVMPDAFGDGTGSHIILFSGNASATPFGAWALSINAGKPCVGIDVSTSRTSFCSGTVVPQNKMVHLAFTFDGSTVKLYVNGGLSTSNALTGTVQGYTTNGLQIGTDSNGGYHFGGYISNVAVYSSTLTEAQIASHAALANGYTAPQTTDYVSTQPVNAVAPVSRMIGWSSWSGPPYGVTMNGSLWSVLANYINYDDSMPNTLLSSATANGITSGYYFDPNQKCTLANNPACGNTNLASSYVESSFAHDCSGNRVYVSNTANHNTLTEPRSNTLISDVNAVDIDPQLTSGYTFAWADNFIPRSYLTTDSGAYTSTTATTPQPYCGYSDSSYLAGIRQLVTNLDMPIAFNGASRSQIASGIGMSPNSIEGTCDSCFSSTVHNKEWLQDVNGPLWLDQVDAELVTGKLGKIFNAKTYGTSYLQTNDIQGYILASLLIGWSPSVTESMTGKTPESLQAAIPPGINIIPMNPVIPASALMQASSARVGDVYARAYRDCYYYGHNLGKCVAIVNPDPNNVANVPDTFTSGYTHALTVDNVSDSSCLTDGLACYKNSISELGDSGTIVESTATPATTLPALGWEILVQ